MVEEPTVVTGVEQIPEEETLVKTGSSAPKVISLTALVGALFLVRKFI